MPTAPRNSARHHRRALAPLVLLALFLISSATFAAPTTKPVAGDEERYLHIHGAGESFWITVPQLGIDGKYVTLIYTRDTAGHWNFLADLADVVTGLSDYHNDLVAVMRNGSWRTIYDGGSNGGAVPASGKITHLGGDADSLYSIVHTPDGRYQLQILLSAPISTPTTTPVAAALPATTQSSQAVTQPATQSASVPTAPAWFAVADLPTDITHAKDPVLAIAVVDNKLYLAGVLPDKRVAVYVLAGNSLTQVAAFTPVDLPLELKVLALGRRAGVWVSPATTNGGAVYTAPAFDPAKRISLGPVAGDAAVSAERIRLIHSEDPKKPDGGKTIETTWDFGGVHKSDAVLDFPLVPGPVNSLVSIILLGILGVAAVASLRRGMTRQVLFNALHLPLAGPVKRLAAGVIDSSPFFITVMYIGASREFPADFTTLFFDPAFVGPCAVALAVAVLHPLILELITGRSLGKFLFGLRVLGIDGAPARPGPIILRNLVRLIEYPLFLLLLTILFTPLRQRLGDTLAGTIVVDDNKPVHIDETA